MPHLDVEDFGNSASSEVGTPQAWILARGSGHSFVAALGWLGWEVRSISSLQPPPRLQQGTGRLQALLADASGLPDHAASRLAEACIQLRLQLQPAMWCMLFSAEIPKTLGSSDPSARDLDGARVDLATCVVGVALRLALWQFGQTSRSVPRLPAVATTSTHLAGAPERLPHRCRWRFQQSSSSNSLSRSLALCVPRLSSLSSPAAPGRCAWATSRVVGGRLRTSSSAPSRGWPSAWGYTFREWLSDLLPMAR